MSIKKWLAIITLLTCITIQSFSQDTFSIVAVDPVTGEVGSAGASCVDVSNFGTNDASFLGELFPGVGAINTQASYNTTNQANARNRMNAGQTPSQIIQWLVNNDVSNQPQYRQYGIAALVNGQAQSAGYTGSSTMNYKNHITGPNYAIQGNILLGQQILDNMEAGFLNEPGDLSCKLMAALQGANVVGADTRCASNGTSSLFAFLKVAQPNDQFGSPSFSIAVTTSNGQGIEPIDALQNKFDNQHTCQITDCNQPCNDNDPCTINDVTGNTCNCAGIFADADGDGVCDADDICAYGDDQIDNNNNGTPDACDPCLIYDFNTNPVLSYDSGQDFGSSQIQDGGNTIYMTGNAWKAINISYQITPQTVITFDFKSTIEGEIHELGFDNDLTLNRDQSLVVYGNQGYNGTLNNATYNSSGNWQSFAVDIGAQFTGTYQYLILSADDDANATGNSYYRNIKIFEDSNGDLVCDVACTVGTACNDNDPCTIGETYDSNCNCTGGNLTDADNDGVCDTNDQCAGIDDNIIGTSCNDNDACTTNDVYDNNCTCSGTFTDSDGDGVCDANDICLGGDDNSDVDGDGIPDFCDPCNNIAGTSCDDADACTTGETYDNNCNCTGGTFVDSDNDGICDVNDNTNGNCTLGGTCNDGDMNTINDVYDTNCNCIGMADTGCNTLIDFENFETGWGIWNDGGTDAALTNNSNYAASGSYSAGIQDNTSTSVITTDNLNLTPYSEIEINFNYYPVSMDNSNEDFWLQISTNGGSNYTTIQTWARSIDFNNNTAYAETVVIPGSFTPNTKIRFRCDASANADDIYLDDIEIIGCSNDNNSCPTAGQTCNDGDVCTSGETYDANCNCTGGTFTDADNDNVCDANDSCPNDPNNACGQLSYCTSTGTNTNYEYINNVTFGSINNTSGTNGGYADFTNFSTTAVLGSTMNISCTAGYAGTTYPENWKVWIDYNRDGDFNDTGEEVFTGLATGTVSGSVTIPNLASPGITAMRVSMQWNANLQPCGSFTYGEVEDYTIILSTNPAKLPSPINVTEESANIQDDVLQVYPNVANNFINIKLFNIFENTENDHTSNVKIFSADGRLVKQVVMSNTGKLQVNVAALASNQYYLISIEKANQQLSSKFFKL